MSDQALVITPADAKARALKVIESNPGCISYVQPEDLDTAALFLPVLSVIKPQLSDFYDPIPKIGIMGKPHLVNLIAEKAGVNIIRTETTKRAEYVWVAHVWGEKRQPDGTMRTEDASFEWDAQLRAEIDILNQSDRYDTDAKKRLHVLEYAKSGESRANTGAEHALIHKLAHVARSFKTPQELMRGMIVARVDRNVDGLLRDPQMREAVINHALGVNREIYGPRNVTEPKAQIAAPEQAEEPEGFDELPPEKPSFAAAAPEPETPEQGLRRVLKAYLDDPAHTWLDKSGDKVTNRTARQMVQALIESPDATLAQLQKMADRIAAHDAKAGGEA